MQNTKNLKKAGTKSEYIKLINELGLKNESELLSTIKMYQADVQSIRNKIEGIVEDPVEKEPPKIIL